MRSWLGRLAALDAAAWLIAVPLVTAALLGSIVAFGGWPDRLLPGGDDGTLRLAEPPAAVAAPAAAARVSAPAEPRMRPRRHTTVARRSPDRRAPAPAGFATPGGSRAPAAPAPSAPTAPRQESAPSARAPGAAPAPVEVPRLEPPPPLPPVELPPVEPLPQLELPEVELPQVELPPVELPPVKLPVPG